jgi:hypothetical protein
MYDKWAMQHHRDVTMRRVAPPLLIDAIRTTDYGDMESRNDLISRLQESVRSYESTAIPLGCRGSFEFAVNTASHMPLEIGRHILPPLPLHVEQALFPLHRPRPSAYFRLVGRSIEQLWRLMLEGRRQSEYGCWSGDPRPAISPAATEAEGTGGHDNTALDASDTPETAFNSLAVSKSRTTAMAPKLDEVAVKPSATRCKEPSGQYSLGTRGNR